MSADIPDERPLQLPELAKAESPELVRAALGRFRRRLLVRGLIVVLIVAAGFVLYPRYFAVHGDLIHDIRHGHGVVVDRLLTVGAIDAHVREVARLSRAEGPRIERYGVHLTIGDRTMAITDRLVANLIPASVDYFAVPIKVSGIFEITQQTGGPFGPYLDLWISLTPGTRTIDIPIGIVNAKTSPTVEKPAGTIHLDMQQLHVPAWIWR